MRQLKSVRNYVIGRFTLDQMLAMTIYMVIVAKVINAALAAGPFTPIGLVLDLAALIISAIYFRFFFKEEILYNSKAMLVYMIAAICGETEINKYTDTTEFINKKIPVKHIHENGIIEFKKGGYGVLLTQVMPHITPAQQAGHLSKVEDLVNALPLNLMVKMIHTSSTETAKPHLEQVQEAINDPATTDEMRLHLYDSYEALSNVDGRLMWDGWVFAGVGKHKNAEEAYLRSLPAISALMQSMRKARIIPTRMTNEFEIIKVYRQQLSMKKVF